MLTGEVQSISIYPSDSLLSYKFEAGTNWTYQKVGSSDTDLVFISSSYATTCNPSPCSIFGNNASVCITYFDYRMCLNSKFYNDLRIYDLHGRYIAAMGDWCSADPIFLTEYQTADTGFKFYLLGKNMSITIGSATYTGVIKMNCRSTDIGYLFHSPTNNVTLYWCPKIGIIRKEIEISVGNFQTWDLIRSTIIK